MKTSDRPNNLPFEVELLAAGGIEAEVVYEGDPTGCPNCQARVLANAA